MFALALAVGAQTACAATGSALGVDPGAKVAQTGGTRVLTVGDNVAIGDLVQTDATGQVQILFDDGTELVVGPSSSLRIEDYLLRSDGSAGKLAVNALSGTFRFVTGNAPKNRYQIETPTGTIGIRGTAFDFTVTKRRTRVLVYHGATQLCARTGECVTLDQSCETGTYDRSTSEIVGRADKLGSRARNELADDFRYALSQQPLLESFRVPSGENCLAGATGRGKPLAVLEPTQPDGPGLPAVRPPPVTPPPVTPPPVTPPPVTPPPVNPPPVDPPPVNPPPVNPPPPGGGHHDDDHDDDDDHGWGHHDNGNHNGGGNDHHDNGWGGGGRDGGGRGGGDHGGGGDRGGGGRGGGNRH